MVSKHCIFIQPWVLKEGFYIVGFYSLSHFLLAENACGIEKMSAVCIALEATAPDF